MKKNHFRLPLVIVLGVVVGALLVVAFAPGVSAHTWRAGEPIVPQCNTTWDAVNARFTNPCTLCDLLDLVAHIVNFIIWTAFAVAGILVVVAGFIILTAEGSGRQKKGREMITKVIVGIVIMLLSYVAVMTILWVLLPNPTDPNTRAQFRIGIGGFEIQCNPTVRVGGGGTTPPPGGGPGSGGPGGLPPSQNVSRYCPGTLAERRNRVCQRINEGVSSVAVDQCLQAVTSTGVNSQLLLSIIEKESSGNPNSENEVYNITERRNVLSCGVAQLSVTTARNLGGRLGILVPGATATERATCDWLKAHPLESIRMADRLLQDRGRQAEVQRSEYNYAMSETELVIAGYNGGSQANEPSRNCTTTQTPDTCPPLVSTAMPRWACPFDRPAGGSCVRNEGYGVTRDYVAIVGECATRP